jgi:hypothetical protein
MVALTLFKTLEKDMFQPLKITLRLGFVFK